MNDRRVGKRAHCGVCGKVIWPAGRRGRPPRFCGDCKDEQFAADARAYRERNKAKIAADARAYRERNKAKIAADARAYRERNKVELKVARELGVPLKQARAELAR